jgi:hypothetical protein
LAQIEEIQARMTLKLALGVRKVDIIKGSSFEASGSNKNLQIRILQQVITFLNSKQDSNQFVLVDTPSLNTNAQKDIIESARKIILDLSPNDTIPANTEDKVVLKFTDTVSDDTGHAVSYGLMGNILCYANRINGNDFAGVRIFRLEEFKDFAIAKKYAESQHDLNELESFLNKLTLSDQIDMKPQKFGNCAFIAPKMMYWFAVYFETLKYLEIHDPSETNKETIAIDFAKQAYKEFSLQERIYLFNNYLTIDSDLGKDLNLLIGAIIKLNKKAERLNLELSDLIDKIDPQILNQLASESVKVLTYSLTHSNNSYQFEDINNLIKILKTPLSEEQKSALYIKALNKLVQETNYDALYYNTIGLFKLIETIKPENILNIPIEQLPKQSKMFINYVTNPNNDFDSLLERLPEIIRTDIANRAPGLKFKG